VRGPRRDLPCPAGRSRGRSELKADGAGAFCAAEFETMSASAFDAQWVRSLVD